MSREAGIEPTDVQDQTAETEVDTVEADALVEEELLVEEISIDGMCGVY